MNASPVNVNTVFNNNVILLCFSADPKPFEFTTLLHTYFRVPDVTQTTVSGLKGLTYVDKVQSILSLYATL